VPGNYANLFRDVISTRVGMFVGDGLQIYRFDYAIGSEHSKRAG
jgi:hypothetical protein